MPMPHKIVVAERPENAPLHCGPVARTKLDQHGTVRNRKLGHEKT